MLLQVVFHARVAEEHPSEPFDIDDVAGLLVDKLVRRHPHVFADGDASTPAEVEQRVGADQGGRARSAAPGHAGGEAATSDLLHGIPASLPGAARGRQGARPRLRPAGSPAPGAASLAAAGRRRDARAAGWTPTPSCAGLREPPSSAPSLGKSLRPPRPSPTLSADGAEHLLWFVQVRLTSAT